MKNKLDNLFKNQLSKHEAVPRPQAWDQLHGQLAANRRKVLGKRLAIAASILLFATVGYIGYQSLDSLTIKKDQFVAETINENVNDDQSQSMSEEGMIETDNSTKNVKDPDISSDALQEFKTEIKSAEKIAAKPLVVDSPVNKTEEKILVDEFELDNSEIEKDTKVIEAKEVINEPVISDQSDEVLLAVIETEEDVPKVQNHKAQKKTYSPIKIIYKANIDSELLASDKKTLINKGIDKLTKFSNERLLTADRKTKLRNTKEDLLAMNFGKLLNKTNKNVEN